VRAVFEASKRSLTPGMGVPRGPRAAPERRTMTWLAAGAALAMSGTGAWLLVRRPMDMAQTTPPPLPAIEHKQPVLHAARPGPPGQAAAKTASVQRPGVVAVGTELADVPLGPPVPQPAREGRATLVVRAPVNAHVRVDGHSQSVRGSTPLRIDVAGGEHRVVVTAPGHARFDQRVRVAPGAAAEVDATRPFKATTPAAAGAAAGQPAATPSEPAAVRPDEPGGATPAASAAAASAEPSKAAEAPPSRTSDAKKPAKESKDTNYTLDPFK
jgi:hypothetical protein